MKKFKDILAQVASRVLDPVWEIPLDILLAVAFAVKVQALLLVFGVYGSFFLR